jgi:DNA topoisomerase-3
VTGFKGRSGKSFRARLALQQNEEGKWRVEFNEPWARDSAGAGTAGGPPESDADAAAGASRRGASSRSGDAEQPEAA